MKINRGFVLFGQKKTPLSLDQPYGQIAKIAVWFPVRFTKHHRIVILITFMWENLPHKIDNSHTHTHKKSYYE